VNSPNSGGSLLLLVLLVLSVIAFAGGKPGKWKLYNFLIILASCAFGFGLGALPMIWGMSAAISGQLAASFLYIFGAAGAYACQPPSRATKSASPRLSRDRTFHPENANHRNPHVI